MLRRTLLSILIALSLLVLIVIEFIHPLDSRYNPDIGLYIKLGEVIVTQKHVPLNNLFAYTFPYYPYVNANWIAMSFFYLFFKFFNFNGLIILQTLLYLLSFGILIFSARKNSFIAIGLVGAAALIILLGRQGVRPEVFSFLFLTITISILIRYKERFTNWIFLLIPLSLLWVNTHIYFPIGIIVMCLYALSALLTSKTGFKKFIKEKNNKTLVFVVIGSLFVTIFNPNWLNGVLFPTMNFVKDYGFFVDENHSIFYNPYPFHRINIFAFVIWVTLLFLFQLLNRKKTNIFYWLTYFFFAVCGIFITRLVPLIIFATFIPFVESLTHLGNSLFANIKPQRTKYILNFASYIVVLLFIIISAVKIVLPFGGFGLGLRDNVYEGHSVKFYVENNLHQPIFNNYDIGSYLDFWLFPKAKVFIDGRPEAYPKEFLENIYFPMQYDSTIFNKVDMNYNFNTIFLTYLDQSPNITLLLKQLVNNSKWKLVYLDNFAVIFVKNNGLNKDIINKLAMSREHIEINNYASMSADELSNVNIFYYKVNWIDHAELLNKYILSKYPHYCPAIANLININIQKNYALAQEYIQKYSEICE